MAKDLPYFKFFCSEWNDGDITLEDYEIQGLFINICSYYWSKECSVTKKLMSKRFRGQEENIKYLLDEGFIKYNNEHLSIKFLNEQFTDVESTSKSKSLAGKKSAKLKKLRKEINELLKNYSSEFSEDLTKLQQEFNTSSTDVDFLLQHISTIKIRGDKRREEEIKEDNNIDIYKIESTFKSLEQPREQNSFTEEIFLQRWKDARKHFDKQPTNIKKLTPFEKVDFVELTKDYGLKDFDRAIQGLFQQKTYPKTRLRPTHFLSRSNFETYLTCFETKEKLFNDNNNKPIQRI